MLCRRTTAHSCESSKVLREDRFSCAPRLRQRIRKQLLRLYSCDRLNTNRSAESLWIELELDDFRGLLWTRFEFALLRRSFGFRSQDRMASNNVCSLHLAIGPDGDFDLHNSGKAQSLGKFRILRFDQHLDLAPRFHHVSNLRFEGNGHYARPGE